MRRLLCCVVLMVIGSATVSRAQSGAINIDVEFKRAHDACLSFLVSSDDRSIRALANQGYRVKKRRKGLSAYLESSRAIPASRRPSIEVFTGKKMPFNAQKTCQIFVAGVPKSTDELLHLTGLSYLLDAGFVPSHTKGVSFPRYTNGAQILGAAGWLEGSIYKNILSRMKK